MFLLSSERTKRMPWVWTRPVRVFQKMISHRKKEALVEAVDVSQTFVLPFRYLGFFGFDFEKWDLSYEDLESD